MSHEISPDDLIDTAQAAQMLGVSVRTMRYYTDTGRLPDRRSGTRRRKFLRSDLDRFKLERGYIRDTGKAVVLYARVSSHRQAKEGDLERQIARLKVAAGRRTIHSVHKDIASGLSERRAGLRAALAACQEAEVGELLVTHPERLARFDTGIIEQLLVGYGVKLRAIGEDESDKSEKSALVRDMLAIVTSFSGRLYGQRSAKARAARTALAASLR
jgi:excisionase family DNA binding protein